MMRALVIADSGPVMAALTQSAIELRDVVLRHANGRSSVDPIARGFDPELVLIDDMRWPPLALARAAEVRRAAPGAAVIVLTEQLEGSWLADALRMGATVLPAGADAETLRRVCAELLTPAKVAA
jgi:DNA-binding NarL/FixJ family response regulator